MDCNRDEAVKAMQVSEKKIHTKDFKGAKEMALKAQRLYPQLDNVARLVAVCEVQCAAEKKLGGSEMDWYGILQVQQSDDIETIKRQYRKFTLLLHPDKTSLTGAEAAFKLIGEAYRVLNDQVSRSKYDIKYLSQLGNRTRLFGQQSSVNLFGPGFFTATSSIPQSRYTSVNLQQPLNVQQPVQPDTIKIACPSCKRMYDYNFANRLIFCQRCLGIFDASDLGKESGNQSAGQTATPNQASQSIGQTGTLSSTTFHNGNATPKTGNAVQADSEVIATQKAGSPSEVSENNNRRDSRNRCNVDNGGDVNTDGDGNVGCSGVKEIPSASLTKRKRMNGSADAGVYRPTVLALVAMDEYKKFGKQKPGRKKSCTSGIKFKVEESSLADCNGSKSMADNNGSKSTVDNNCRSSTADVKDRKSMAEDNNCSKSMAEDNESKSVAGNNGSKSVISVRKIKEVPEPEFHTFALRKPELQRIIKANQTWVLYDPADSMPRRYACVRKVLKPGFKVNITWLEPDPDDQGEVDWCRKKLPVACGKFRYAARTELVKDYTVFSHEYIHSTKGKGKSSFQVYPRKGEIWALYQDWDLGWSSETKKHSQYEFDFVEVLSDFSEKSGAGVSYLGKVKGFVSLFESAQQNGVLRSQVPADQLYRFSHQIPSHKMTGREGYGVPADSFELDPASLPASVFDRRSTVTIAKPSGFIPSGGARPSAKQVKNDREWVEDKKGNLNDEPIVID